MGFDQDTNRWYRFYRLLKFFVFSLFRYDVFHFHTDLTLLPHNIDLQILRALRKKIFFHFHGIEIRDIKRIPKHCEKADGYFVSTADLIEIVPKAILLPQQIDLNILPNPTAIIPEKQKLVVLHVIICDEPYGRQLKGTDWILGVFDAISTIRGDVEFRFISNLLHDQVISEINNADIIVDQIAQGWYGNLSIESMALGKTAVNWINPKLIQFLWPKCPIVNTSKESLQEDLIRLIDDPFRREKLGKEGRLYVERIHAAERVANITVKCYIQAFKDMNRKE
jgi:glycosyltransferase involved in cell wall biosynthesis